MKKPPLLIRLTIYACFIYFCLWLAQGMRKQFARIENKLATIGVASIVGSAHQPLNAASLLYAPFPTIYRVARAGRDVE